MAERFNAAVLKTAVGQLTLGSNPSLSASIVFHLLVYKKPLDSKGFFVYLHVAFFSFMCRVLVYLIYVTHEKKSIYCLSLPDG